MGRTVLIVDDHAPFRNAARELLAAAGYEVVGDAADGRSGVVEALRLAPAIVLLDVQLPDIDGFEVARQLAAADHAGGARAAPARHSTTR